MSKLGRVSGRSGWLWPGLLAATLGLAAEPLRKDDGYRGIWYCKQPTKDEYRYKYSGGMATYPQQHAPIAIYREREDEAAKPEVACSFYPCDVRGLGES